MRGAVLGRLRPRWPEIFEQMKEKIPNNRIGLPENSPSVSSHGHAASVFFGFGGTEDILTDAEGAGKREVDLAQRGRGGSEMYGVRNRRPASAAVRCVAAVPGGVGCKKNAAEASPRRPHNLTENYGTYLMNRSSRYLGSVHIWSSMISSSLSMWRRISSK